MPALSIRPKPIALTSANPHYADVCEDCGGTGVDIDTDGSQTGAVGTPVPCICTGGR